MFAWLNQLNDPSPRLQGVAPGETIEQRLSNSWASPVAWLIKPTAGIYDINTCSNYIVYNYILIDTNIFRFMDVYPQKYDLTWCNGCNGFWSIHIYHISTRMIQNELHQVGLVFLICDQCYNMLHVGNSQKCQTC